MNDRRHPLPCTVRTVRLRSNSYDESEGRPYSLHIGRDGGMTVSLSEQELWTLWDGIKAALCAPFRILIPDGGHLDGSWRADGIRRRLDKLHARHPYLEVALLDVDAFESAAMAWASDARVRVLIYQNVADMFADGGSRVLIVAGDGALEHARLAHDAGIDVSLIRAPEAVSRG